MIRADQANEELTLELQRLRKRITELEAFHTVRQPGGETLQQSEAEAILESFAEGLLVLDKKGRLIDANKKLEEISGYQKKELVGKTTLSLARLLTHKGLTVFWRNPLKRTVDASAAPHEVDIFKKNGELITVEITCHQLKMDGKIAGHLVILENVTERRRAERESSESSEVYKSLVNHVGVGIFKATPGGSGRFLEVNLAMEAITGYSREELLKMDVTDLYVHPEERAEHVKKALSGVPTTSWEVRYKKKDGTEITMRDSKVAVRGNDGKTLYLEGFLEDISERKRAEDALRASEQNLRNSMDSSLMGISIVDTEWHALYVNQVFLDIFGFKNIDEVSRTSLQDCYTPEEHARYLQRKEKRERGETVPDKQAVEIVDTNGVIHVIKVYLKEVLWDGKQQRQLIYQDITELQQAEKALKASEENFHNSMDSSSMGIRIMGDHDSTIYANQALLDMFGYKNIEELKASPPQEHYTPESHAAFVQRHEQFLRGESLPDQLEFDIIWKDGAIRHLQLSSKKVLWNGKQQYQFLYNDITERKNAEQALQSSEQNFRNSLDSSSIGTRISDNEDHTQYANQALLDIFGYENIDEARKSPPQEHYTPESYASYVLRHEKMLRGEQMPDLVEIDIERKDGVIRHLDVSMKEVFWDGRQQYQTLYNDITERKQAEEVLKQSEENLRTTLDSLGSGVLVIDAQTKKIVDVNLSAAKMIGIDRNEIVGHECHKFVCPAEIHKCPISDLGQTVDNSDKILLRRYSESIPILKSVNRIKLGGRNYFIENFVDITSLKQAEKRLEEATQEWRTTFDSITDLISIHDKDNRIIRANKAMADLLKTTPQDLIGKFCREVMRGDQECPVNCPQLLALKTGKSSSLEIFNPTLGLHFQESASPLFNEKGEITGTVLVARDVTQQKRMEEQLILTDRLASIGELSSGIAHELNNPLTSVIGFSQLLMEGDVPANMKEDLGIVYNEAQRAAAIVKNLLTFARKHAPVKQLSQVNTVIEDVLRLRAYEQKVNNIEIENRLVSDLPEIMIDNFQMQQVFLNIMVNAEFAMQEAHHKGKLVITTEKSRDVIRVIFTDDGPGISKETLKHIFDPFFTTKEVGKGTGLGLSICHGIVTEHSGKIYARSEKGSGTTFVVELPLINGQ
jgi:PAS domain S-box-containing protein